MRSPKLSKGIYILPSLCTTASMLCGFYSVVRSIAGDYTMAAAMVFISGFFDMLDGRVARMTKTQSDFGKEYDSLVDLASFGMAPAVLMYTWSMSQFKSLGFFFSFLFFACVALRLARFNIQVESIEKSKFQGLPCPPAACWVASFVLFYEEFIQITPVKSYVMMVVVPLLALLMVSNTRFRSFKEYNVQKGNSLYALMGGAALIGLIAVKPQLVLFLIASTYAISGPLSSIWPNFKKEKKTEDRLARLRGSSKKLSVVKLASVAQDKKGPNEAQN